jgi:hypothetical protein
MKTQNPGNPPEILSMESKTMRLRWKTIGTIGAALAVTLVWRKFGLPERTGDASIMAEELKKVLLYAVPPVLASKYAADKFDSGLYRWLDDGGPALPED